jgi:terminase small subunit-like protein
LLEIEVKFNGGGTWSMRDYSRRKNWRSLRPTGGYGDGARAAAAAGYGVKYAKVQAHVLLKKPAIRQALEEKQRQIIGQSVRLDTAKLSEIHPGQSVQPVTTTD